MRAFSQDPHANAAVYRPRNAAGSPLYRLLQDHLEEFLAQGGLQPGKSPTHPAVVERSLRAFLECGIFRFGVVRFRCPKCDKNLFVALSCKRRGVCPSCDGKRIAITAAHALDAVLPDIAYRQWVLVLPKRLRYFMHHSPGLAGEASRILARELELHYRRKLGESSPAQLHFIQRSGSTLNLHVHVHAVVSDGVFRAAAGVLGSRRLEFQPCDAPTEAELGRIVEAVRRKTLRRFAKLGVIDRESAEEMLSWEHSGFSVHAATVVARGDRAALERLLYYCGRPALSVRRLSYRKAEGLAIYEVRDKASGSRRLVLTPAAFIGRLVSLVPPPRKNVVRYYGALAPNSPLRPLVAEAARALSADRPAAIVRRAATGAIASASASVRAWAQCLSRVFEVDPLICLQCGVRLEPVAVILADRQLDRLLEHLGLPTAFPILAPARLPPVAAAEESQVGPDAPLSQSIDWIPPDDDVQAPSGDWLGA